MSEIQWIETSEERCDQTVASLSSRRLSACEVSQMTRCLVDAAAGYAGGCCLAAGGLTAGCLAAGCLAAGCLAAGGLIFGTRALDVFLVGGLGRI